MRPLRLSHARFVASVLLVALVAEAGAQVGDPFRIHSIFRGRQIGDRAGVCILGTGDFNRDGFFDVLVGVPGDDPNGLADAGSAVVYGGRGGVVLRRFVGTEAGGRFGEALAAVPDVNADTVRDFLIAAPFASDGALPEAGKVFIVSGADGAILGTLVGDQAMAHFGATVIVPGDLNSDGVVDYVIGAPLAQVGPNDGAGKAIGISGADRSVLFTLSGTQAGESLGSALVSLSDLDSDGRPEFAVGSPGATVGNLVGAGRVQIFTASGAIHVPVDGTETDAHFGSALGRAGDLSGDHVGDLLVGAPDASPRGIAGAGSLFVFNARTAQFLLRLDGEEAGLRLGAATIGVSDVSGDAVEDIAAGAPGAGQAAGRISLFSGADGSFLFSRIGAPGHGTGAALARVGDVDVDGHDDFFYGEPSFGGSSGENVGRAMLVMWDTSRLGAEGTPRRGSPLTITFDADPDDIYMLILSRNGGPGARITPIPFPNAPGNSVALDVGLENVRFTFTRPGFMGAFDANGHAEFTIQIPMFQRPGLPLTVTGQFITLRGAASLIQRVSNAVSFVISE